MALESAVEFETRLAAAVMNRIERKLQSCSKARKEK